MVPVAADGLADAEAELLGESDADGERDLDALDEGLSELEGDSDADGESERLAELEADLDADADALLLALDDGLTEALGDPSWSKPKYISSPLSLFQVPLYLY